MIFATLIPRDAEISSSPATVIAASTDPPDVAVFCTRQPQPGPRRKYDALRALSAAVPLRIDLDIQFALMVSSLYILLGIRVGQGFDVTKAPTIFRKLVNASATIRIAEDEIIAMLGRQDNNPLLFAAHYGEIAQPIPWLENWTLKIRFS